MKLIFSKHDISQPTIPDYHPTIPDYHDMGPARVMLPIIDISSEFFSTNFSSAVSTSTAVATSSIIPSLPTTVALPTISPSNAPSSTLEDSDGAGPSRPQSPSKTEPPSDSEDDTSVYGESDDDDSDDEYVPAGGASPKRKRSPRSDKLLLRNSSASSPPALGETEDDLPSPTKFPRAAPPRSKQVLTTLEQTDVSSSSTLKGANRWACPHCDFVQKNHRMPDLKRHIRKHYPTNKYVCCGVPVEEKEKYGAKETAAPMEYNGRMMVGGCMQSMSRRDALKRHIDNKNVTCVGDLEGDWHQFQG